MSKVTKKDIQQIKKNLKLAMKLTDAEHDEMAEELVYECVEILEKYNPGWKPNLWQRTQIYFECLWDEIKLFFYFIYYLVKKK